MQAGPDRVGEGARDEGAAAFRSERFQRWGLIAVVAAMLLALWVFVLGASAVQRQRLMNVAAEDLSQLNRAVSAQVESLFRAADTDLRTIDLWLGANARIDPLSDRAFAGLVDELRRSGSGLIELRLATADGRLFDIPSPRATPLADVSGRPHFRAALSDAGRGLHVGEAAQDAHTRKWSIPLARRQQASASGPVVGIASVDLSKLVELHEELRIKPRGTITLVRADGKVLSRTPYQEALIGMDLSDLPTFRSEIAPQAAGVFQADGARSDGVRRLTAFRRLQLYPVIVFASQPVVDVTEVFERRLGWALTVLAVLTMTVFGFTFALHRSLLSLQDARRDMQRLATSDSLTGVMNRRAFLDAADREFTRARRYSRPCAVLMLDLDHFKRVNDTHGHAAGDAVLRECAAAWGALLRDQDLLGRLGGEEFCALLPETGSERGVKAAGRMRAAIESLQFRGTDGPFTVTVSVGLTDVLPGDDQFDQVLERADRALYIAKQNGRNRVERVESLKAARPVLDPASGGQR